MSLLTVSIALTLVPGTADLVRIDDRAESIPTCRRSVEHARCRPVARIDSICEE